MNSKNLSVIIYSFLILSTFCYFLGKEENLFDTLTAFIKAMLFLSPVLIVSFLFSKKEKEAEFRQKRKPNILPAFVFGLPVTFLMNKSDNKEPDNE